MIIPDELNMVSDLGTLSVYDSNPVSPENLQDPAFLKKVVGKAVGKLKSLILQAQNLQKEEQELRPLEAQVIDFSAGKAFLKYFCREIPLLFD